ncbi:hypothetical protein BJY52DRAFT_1212696 [Lactarius psammicola]|nr:hypothetical protein BJY52DRAFT_1212696 [Lactarius psammicola]
MADILLAVRNAQFGQHHRWRRIVVAGARYRQVPRNGVHAHRLHLECARCRRVGHDQPRRQDLCRCRGALPVMREAVALAREIAAKGQITVQVQKEAVNAVFGKGLSEDL